MKDNHHLFVHAVFRQSLGTRCFSSQDKFAGGTCGLAFVNLRNKDNGRIAFNICTSCEQIIETPRPMHIKIKLLLDGADTDGSMSVFS